MRLIKINTCVVCCSLGRSVFFNLGTGLRQRRHKINVDGVPNTNDSKSLTNLCPSLLKGPLDNESTCLYPQQPEVIHII